MLRARTSSASCVARIVGAGAYLPTHVVTSRQIAQAIPGWSAEKIEEKTGIVERRYLWPIDVERGRCVPPPTGTAAMATDMAESAFRDALSMGDVPPGDVDVLFVVTCTPDQPRFSYDAMELQRRIGLRPDCHCSVFDSGCGGSLYALDLVVRMLESGAIRTAAVIGTNLCSALIEREAYVLDAGTVGPDGESTRPYLSTYVFGDGASALLLRRDSGACGVRASLSGSDHYELVRSPGGGTQSPSYGSRYRAVDHTFVVNGRLVMASYMETMHDCTRAVADAARVPLGEVERFYFHQPNARVLEAFSRRMELREDQLATNVARVGNTSSAGMFGLLAEDLRQGRVALGSGTPVVFAAIGAGIHYGSQLAHL